MGSDTISALYDSLTSQPNKTGIAAVLRFYHSVRATAENASFSSIANFLRGLYRNDTVNWGQVVFLTTCVIAMAGCGLLSSLVRRKRSGSGGSRAQRPSLRKSLTKSSSKTLSSSSEDDYEDEDYDSNASLRHGTNPNYKPKEDWLSEPQKQSSDGMSCNANLPLRLYDLTSLQHTRQTRVFSGNSLHTTLTLPPSLPIPLSARSTVLIHTLLDCLPNLPPYRSLWLFMG